MYTILYRDIAVSTGVRGTDWANTVRTMGPGSVAASLVSLKNPLPFPNLKFPGDVAVLLLRTHRLWLTDAAMRMLAQSYLYGCVPLVVTPGRR